MKSKKKTESLITTKAKIWFLINLFCSVMYLMWRIFFTIPIGYGVISIIAGVTLLIVEVLGLLESLVHFTNMFSTRKYEKPDVPLYMFPDVDVFVSTYNEEPALLEKTLLACKRMDYPNKNSVHIFLCDDGHRDSMRQLAERLGVNYLCREDHSGQKAGNLNNALKHSYSPYVVTFDSDMIPQSSFLMETMPYFVDAEIKNRSRDEKHQIKLGFLQTPQSFYDLDLFQFNLHSESTIPNEQDYFYRDIEVARTKTNSCIYGGSNTVLSREALEKVGGFYTGAITEDFATGILIQKAGYVSLGIGKQLVSGVSAKTLQELIQQRVRWARGVISTGRKMHIYTSKELSFGQKINYWASIWYWYAPIKRFLYIFSPILYATFGYTIFRCSLWQVLLFWLPMFISSNVCLSLLSNNIRNTKWTAIYEYAMFPYMFIPVLLETFGVSLTKFKVTKKGGAVENDKSSSFVYKIPFIILIVLSIIGLVRCITTVFVSGSLGPVVVVFWLIYNLYAMMMCLFFTDSRVIYREAERVRVAVKGVLTIDGKCHDVVTKDISENGVALYIDSPFLIENGEGHVNTLELHDRRWTAKLRVEIKHTEEQKDKEGKKWLYSFGITEFIGENSYDQFLAILYDRVTTNPHEIQKNHGVYDDLSSNLVKRMSATKYRKRHYPRIPLNTELTVIVKDKEQKVEVLDFNYLYFSTKTRCAAEDEGAVTFLIGKYRMEAQFERMEQDVFLYRVLDAEKLYFEKELRDSVMKTAMAISNGEVADTDRDTQEQKEEDTFREMDIL